MVNVCCPITPGHGTDYDRFPNTRSGRHKERDKKNRLTKRYRRAFRQQLHNGLEAISEFQPPEIWSRG